MTLDEALELVSSRAPYMQCELLDESASEQGWISVADLASDAERLEALICSSGEARGTSSRQVAASIYMQSFAYLVASVSVSTWAIGCPSPTLNPDELAIRLAQNRPGQLGVWTSKLVTHDASSLASSLMDGVISPAIDKVRQPIQVGGRMLYGDVASSIAAVFRAMHSNGPRGDEAVRLRATEFFAAHPALQGLGKFSTIDDGTSLGWYWDRRSCCLWFQTDEAAGRFCDGCSLCDTAERTERRRSELRSGPCDSTTLPRSPSA